MARDTGVRRMGFHSFSLRKKLTDTIALKSIKASRLKRSLAQPGMYNFPINFQFFRYSFVFSAQWRYITVFVYVILITMIIVLAHLKCSVFCLFVGLNLFLYSLSFN